MIIQVEPPVPTNTPQHTESMYPLQLVLYVGIVNQTFYKKNLLLGVALHKFRSTNNKNAIGPSLHVKDIVEVSANNGIHQALLA